MLCQLYNLGPARLCDNVMLISHVELTDASLRSFLVEVFLIVSMIFYIFPSLICLIVSIIFYRWRLLYKI